MAPDALVRPQTPSTGSRLAGVEGLRALAAITVLVHHVPMYIAAPSGGPAVIPGSRAHALLVDLQWGLVLFFALSGFLLFRPFARSLLEGRPLPDVRAFLRNRALRILPLYWVALIVTSLVFAAAVIRAPGEIGRLTDPVVLLADFLLVQGYAPRTIATGIGPAWSLAVEVVFYLALPVLAVLAAFVAARRAGSPRARLAAALLPVAALLAVGLVGKAVFHEASDRAIDPGWLAVLRLSFPAQADLFAFGMLAAVAHVLATSGRLRTGRWDRAIAAVGAVGLVGLAILMAGRTGATHASWEDTVVAAACGLALWVVVAPRARGTRSPLISLLEWRPVVLVGLASYGVYLWHTPLLILLGRWGLRAEGNVEILLAAALATVVTVALSYLTFRLVEQPALARKRTMSPSSQAPPAPASDQQRAVELAGS